MMSIITILVTVGVSLGFSQMKIINEKLDKILIQSTENSLNVAIVARDIENLKIFVDKYYQRK